MGEIIHLSRERIQITVFTRGCGLPWAKYEVTRQLENEQTLAIVNGVVKELGLWYFEVRTRSWALHFFEAMLRGGWWSPVVVVGRNTFSQGEVPDRAKLRAYLSEQIHIHRPRLAS